MRYSMKKGRYSLKRYLDRRHFALDIGRVGRNEALAKWVAMGGEAVAGGEADWV